jgi:hypothetical protein
MHKLLVTQETKSSKIKVQTQCPNHKNASNGGSGKIWACDFLKQGLGTRPAAEGTREAKSEKIRKFACKVGTLSKRQGFQFSFNNVRDLKRKFSARVSLFGLG